MSDAIDMVKSIHFILGVALLIGAGLTGCKSSEPTQQSTKEGNESELAELYWARQDSALNNYSQGDVKFMTGMICHHAQALVMSRLAPENGASPQIQTLTSRIINAQKDEIKTMQSWLTRRNEPVPKIKYDSLEMQITINSEPYTEYKKMPGVLSQQKIHELAEAKGNEFDRLFLKYMIQHHEGAVIMVDNLFSKDEAAKGDATYRLASGIQADQRTEIDRMKQMLQDLSDSI